MVIDSQKLLLRFGDAVRTERKSRAMSQEELAHESGISTTYAGEIERGEKMVSLETITRIARAMKMTGSEFLKKAGI